MDARACRPCPHRRLGHRPGPPKHAEHASMHAATFHGKCVGCVSENHARADGFGRAASGCGLQQVTPAAPQAPPASAVPQPGTQAGPTQTCRACKHSCDYCTLKCLHAYRACACMQVPTAPQPAPASADPPLVTQAGLAQTCRACKHHAIQTAL